MRPAGFLALGASVAGLLLFLGALIGVGLDTARPAPPADPPAPIVLERVVYLPNIPSVTEVRPCPALPPAYQPAPSPFDTVLVRERP